MKQIFLPITMFALLLYSCQPSCTNLYPIQEALVFNFNIVNANGEILVGNDKTISLEEFQISGIDLNGETGEVTFIHEFIDKDSSFLSTLTYNGVIERTSFKMLIFDYGNAYPSDTLNFDYHYTEEDCGNYLGDYTITLGDEILCHRCYRQVIEIQK